MTDLPTIATGALALLAAGGVTFALRRAHAARAADRAAYLDACTALFTSRTSTIQPSGFPRMSGTWMGDNFDIQIVPDTLTVRKLPALWVLVSLPQDLPVQRTVDLMMRATGLETFSNFSHLPAHLRLPDGLPPEAALRSDMAGPVPFADALRRTVAAVDAKRLKEILITPKGVRIVFLAEEAARTRYLLYRDAEMGRSPLSPATLSPVLAAARALRDAVTQDLTERKSA